MRNTLSILIFMSFILFSCKREGCTDPIAINFEDNASKDDGTCIYKNSLTINFTQTVDGEKLCVFPFGCFAGEVCLDDHSCCISSLNYENTAQEEYNIQTLKYIISDLALHSNNGDTLLLKEVHYIDVNSTNTLIYEITDLQEGNYSSISFTMGLSNENNISNKYVNETFHSPMIWPDLLGGGYHYMKLEGAYNNDSTFYNTHTGALGSSNIDPLRQDYSFNVSENISINITDRSRNRITINMEINNWYNNPYTINLASGIMADSAKQMKIYQNGIQDVFSIE